MSGFIPSVNESISDANVISTPANDLAQDQLDFLESVYADEQPLSDGDWQNLEQQRRDDEARCNAAPCRCKDNSLSPFIVGLKAMEIQSDVERAMQSQPAAIRTGARTLSSHWQREYRKSIQILDWPLNLAVCRVLRKAEQYGTYRSVTCDPAKAAAALRERINATGLGYIPAKA